MINLAGNAGCDAQIKRELELAKIPVRCLSSAAHSEVPYSIYGELSGFTFKRAWYYWEVSGRYLPLDIAEELYRDPVGRNFVRVVGHIGCPPPSQWARPYRPTPNDPPAYVCSGDNCVPNPAAPLGIDSYHIDTQAGLDLFAEKIRQLQ